MTQAEQIHRFCSALIGGHDGQGDDRLSGQMVSVWTLPDKRTRWCPADDPGAIASAVLEAAGRQPAVQAVYIGMGTVPAELVRAQQEADPKRAAFFRAKKTDVTGMVALWADIDIGTVGHEGGPYPPDVKSARRILDSVGLPPTVLVHSGYGLQAWWALSEPWLAADYPDPDAARLDMYNLSRDWVSTLRFRADVIGGWKIDSVFDLSRLLRAPGALNMKVPRDPRPVKIIEYNPNQVYDLDDFRERLAPDKVLAAYSLRADNMTGLTVPELPGINLTEVWARVTSEGYRHNGYTPLWLDDLLELSAEHDKLKATWDGKRPELHNDPSSYDAALVRLLHDRGLSIELQVEAIMCRRLRSGDNPDKVDPHQRTDYLLRTLGFVHASAREAQERADKIEDLKARAAAGVEPSAHPAPQVPEPTPRPSQPDDEHDTFAEYLDEELRYSLDPDALPDEPEPDFPDEPEPQAAPAAPPPPPTRPPAPRAGAGDEHDPWGTRGDDTVEVLTLLTNLLIPEPYRKRGVEVWALEHRDYGDAQRGRVLFKIPQDYRWPDGESPALYRPGRPLCSEWYKRDVFDTPKGFRLALEHDGLIPAEPVGNRKADWQQLITLLVPYWRRDSSASDLATSAVQWLHEFLVSNAPTIDETIAVENKRPLLIDHRDWGRQGAPIIYLPFQSFLDYVGNRPGGLIGRNSKTLQSYLDLTPRRPRLRGANGKIKRATWFEIGAHQFGDEEWDEILTLVQEAIHSREERLRVIDGEAS